jgi:hypothetical protein
MGERTVVAADKFKEIGIGKSLGALAVLVSSAASHQQALPS